MNLLHCAEQWGRSAARCYSFADAEDELRLLPVPESFVCPMTLSVMLDPVATADGSVYEREQIEKWIRECRQRKRPVTSPSTGVVLDSANLMPLAALQKAIETYLSYRPEVRDSLTMGRSFEEAAQALQNDLVEKEAVRSSLEEELTRLRDALAKMSEERDRAETECIRLRAALAAMAAQSVASTDNCSKGTLAKQRSSTGLPQQLATQSTVSMHVQARGGSPVTRADSLSTDLHYSGTSGHVELDGCKSHTKVEWSWAKKFGMISCALLAVSVGLHGSAENIHLRDQIASNVPNRRSLQQQSDISLGSDSQDKLKLQTSLQKEQFVQGGINTRAADVTFDSSIFGQAASSLSFPYAAGVPDAFQGVDVRTRQSSIAPIIFPASVPHAHALRAESTPNWHGQPWYEPQSQQQIQHRQQEEQHLWDQGLLQQERPQQRFQNDQREQHLQEQSSKKKLAEQEQHEFPHLLQAQDGKDPPQLDQSSQQFINLLQDHQQHSKFMSSFLQALETDPQLASLVQYSIAMAISTLPEDLQDTAVQMWQVLTGQSNGRTFTATPEQLQAVFQAVLQNIGEVQEMRDVLERVQNGELSMFEAGTAASPST